MGDMFRKAYDDAEKQLSNEDLQKLNHWSEKRRLCKSPHCGERCVIEPEEKERKNETTNNTI